MTTLVEVKQYLRVQHDEDDQFIERLIVAGEGHVEHYLGDDMPSPVPAPIKAAILLLVADLYENRERQQDVKLYRNPTFDLLLKPYRSCEVL